MSLAKIFFTQLRLSLCLLFLQLVLKIVPKDDDEGKLIIASIGALAKMESALLSSQLPANKAMQKTQADARKN